MDSPAGVGGNGRECTGSAPWFQMPAGRFALTPLVFHRAEEYKSDKVSNPTIYPGWIRLPVLPALAGRMVLTFYYNRNCLRISNDCALTSLTLTYGSGIEGGRRIDGRREDEIVLRSWANLTPHTPAPVAVEVHMQPGGEAKALPLADFGQPNTPLMQDVRPIPSGIRITLPAGVKLRDQRPHFSDVVRAQSRISADNRSRHQAPQDVRLQAQASRAARPTIPRASSSRASG